ncbi:uncharacterized protein Tco025E_08034, partial [Trypanosoma conorhini]
SAKVRANDHAPAGDRAPPQSRPRHRGRFLRRRVRPCPPGERAPGGARSRRNARVWRQGPGKKPFAGRAPELAVSATTAATRGRQMPDSGFQHAVFVAAAGARPHPPPRVSPAL